MILQVHDELVFEVHDDKNIPYLMSNIKKIMEGVFKLKCPLIVEGKEAENWGEK